MKTKKIRVLVFVLIYIFHIMSIGNTKLLVNAEADVYYLHDNYMESYFHNLTNNIGENYFGSCGYVAAGMILSYYDTFHDDSIIPEFFDSPAKVYNASIKPLESPGIKNEFVSEYDSLAEEEKSSITPNQYISEMELLANQGYFHPYLLLLGAESEFYPDPDNSSDFAGILETDIEQLIEKYLTHNTNITISGEGNEDKVFPCYSNSDFSLQTCSTLNTGTTESEVIDFAKNQILMGNPVILTVFINGKGHVYVAYKYEHVENYNSVQLEHIFYCNYGNKIVTCNTPEEFSSNNSYYRSATVLSFNTQHSCSNNYFLEIQGEDGNIVSTQYYCYEHKDLITYNHVCSYTDGYQTFPRTDPNEHIKHKKMCHCTNYVVENHTSTCGCSISAHVGSTYTYYSPTQHSYVCTLCGVTAYAPHVAKKNNPGFCISCNFFFDSGFGQIIHSIKPSGGMVTANGSYIGYNGIIYLDECDVEAYFNGTLVFYKEDSSSQTA